MENLHTKSTLTSSSSNSKPPRIAILGLDSAGYALSALAARNSGSEVVGFDSDAVKIAQLENLEATDHLFLTSLESDLSGAESFILCAPTPFLEHGRPDLRHLAEAARVAGRHLPEDGLVAVESIVNPGTCEHAILPILEKESGLSRGEFFFSHVPMLDGVRGARVAGGLNAESLSRATALYRERLGQRVLAMRSIKEAEAVRMIERARHELDAALACELSSSFDRMDLDLAGVLERGEIELDAAGAKEQSACPRYYIGRSGHEHMLEQPLLSAARRINDSMPEYIVNLLGEALREKRRALKGAKIALVESDRARNPGRRSVRDALAGRGAEVSAFDPAALGRGGDFERALECSCALVIAEAVSEHAALAPSTLAAAGILVILDAYQSLEKEAFEGSGIVYRGIGRGA